MESSFSSKRFLNNNEIMLVISNEASAFDWREQAVNRSNLNPAN